MMRLKDVSKVLNYDTRKRPVDQKAKLTKQEANTDQEWKEQVEPPKKSKYLIYLTISTFLFFVTAIAVAYFVQHAGIDREISPHKITLVTQGAATADIGSAVPLTIRIANRNPVPIQDATLFVTYPEGTFANGEEITRLRRDKFILGEVKTGEIVNRSIAPIFYGKSGEKKTISYVLEYDVTGVAQSTKIPQKYEVLLRNPPVIISKPRYTNPIAGKEVSFTVDVRSNTSEILPLIYVRLHYPLGFEPDANSFSPHPSNTEGTEWQFSGLKPGTKKTIQVSGTIRGREGESQAVVSRVLVSPTGSRSEAVEVASEEDVLVIGKAFLDINLNLNGREAEEVAVSPGGTIRGDIRWVNQDSSRITDLIITAKITGTGLDESSITARNNGRFDEIRKEIVWDRRSSASLASLDIGRSGRASFELKALPDRVEFAQEQKYVRVSISARALRAKTGKIEEVRNVAVGQVNLRSVFQVVANTLYATSAIRNAGPMPPQVGKTTTYALKYFIKNSGNKVSNVKIQVPLGDRAELTDITSGIALTELVHNEAAHSVIMLIPSLSGSGSQSSRSVELQVAVKPKPEDMGRHILLAKRATYTTRDTFTGEEIEGSVKSITTQITAEPIERTKVIEYQQEIAEDE